MKNFCDTLGDFLSSQSFKLLASSVVVAALVTSVFNYASLRSTNSRLCLLEDQKRGYELYVYRMTTLRAALHDLLKLKGPGDAWQSVMLGRGNIVDIGRAEAEWAKQMDTVYQEIKPFLDSDLSESIDAVIRQRDGVELELAKNIDGSSAVLRPILDRLWKLNASFYLEFRNCLSKQIDRLVPKKCELWIPTPKALKDLPT